MTYPKTFFISLESARKTYECHPTDDKRERLAWVMNVLSAKFAAWEIEERIKDAK